MCETAAWDWFFFTYFHQWYYRVASLMQMLNEGNLGSEVTCFFLSCWTYIRSVRGSSSLGWCRWEDKWRVRAPGMEGRPFLDINQAVIQPKQSALISLFYLLCSKMEELSEASRLYIRFVYLFFRNLTMKYMKYTLRWLLVSKITS